MNKKNSTDEINEENKVEFPSKLKKLFLFSGVIYTIIVIVLVIVSVFIPTKDNVDNEDSIKLRTFSTTKYCKIINGEFIKINTIAHFEDNLTLNKEFQNSVYYLTRVN